jgi:DNA excision repair protein ERCC-2
LHVDELVSLCKSREEGAPHGICPWKAARESASLADVVVCDYNHVFVEAVRESSLTAMGIGLEDTLLVVDEAHNLPDRIRRGFERRITVRVVRDAIIEIEEHRERTEAEINAMEESDADSKIAEVSRLRRSEAAMRRLLRGLPEWFAEIDGGLTLSRTNDQRVSMTDFLERVSSILAEDVERAVELGALLKLLQSIRVDIDKDDDDIEEETACMRLAVLLHTCMQNHDSPAFALVHDKMGDEEHRLTTHLLDPGVVSGGLLDECRGAVMMSGTLFPPQMYYDLLNIPEGRVSIVKEYTSHFLTERRPVLIAKDVTSRYAERGEENTARIREHIHSVLHETPGHVAVFAPSYAMLEQIVLEDEDWAIRRRHLLEERSGASKEQMDRMVDKLHQLRRSKTPALLAGVLGGKLAEGVDYPENILDAVICIGLPLPPPSARQDALKDYYEDAYGSARAWRYASSQPAVNRLMQALGRPIRKAADRALVVLLEKRLMQRGFKICMPDGVHVVETVDSDRTARHAKRFFKKYPDPARHSE